MVKKINYFIFTKSIGLYLNILVFLAPKKAQMLAYTLFSTPRKGRFKANKVPKILAATTKEILNVGDQYLQTYRWTGNKEVIMLLHGWESNSARWKKIIPYLKELGHTIVAIDAPGHGLTSGNEFNVILYAQYIQEAVQKFKPSILIGHSIGGAACVYNQFQYPDAGIKKIVLLGAPADIGLIVKNYITLLWLNFRNTRLLNAHFQNIFGLDITNFSVDILAKNSFAEALIIHDVNDSVVSYNAAQKLKAGFKNSLFMQTEGLGHSLHCDTVYEKIVAFIKN